MSHGAWCSALSWHGAAFHKEHYGSQLAGSLLGGQGIPNASFSRLLSHCDLLPGASRSRESSWPHSIDPQRKCGGMQGGSLHIKELPATRELEREGLQLDSAEPSHYAPTCP